MIDLILSYDRWRYNSYDSLKETISGRERNAKKINSTIICYFLNVNFRPITSPNYKKIKK